MLGGAKISSVAPLSAAMAGWKPRLIHIRGFCPYGSGAKLNRREETEMQKIIMGHMGPTDRLRLQALEPLCRTTS